MQFYKLQGFYSLAKIFLSGRLACESSIFLQTFVHRQDNGYQFQILPCLTGISGHRGGKCKRGCLYLLNQKAGSLPDSGGSPSNFISWLFLLPMKSMRVPEILYYNHHWLYFLYIIFVGRLYMDPQNLGDVFLEHSPPSSWK